MSNLFKEMFLNTLMAYARKETKNPWDEYADLIMKPSVMDKIIEVLKQESAEQKAQRINKQRADQRAYEKQRASRVRENKRQHGLITEEEEQAEKKKDENRIKLNDLKQSGKDIKNYLNHGENVRKCDLFTFKEPVAGCKYDIGGAFGHVVIPMDQTDLGAFLSKIHEYVYLIVNQLFDNLNKTIDFNIITVSEWVYPDEGIMGRGITYDRTEDTKWSHVTARNQIMSICDKIVEQLTVKFEIPQKRSNQSFRKGVLIRVEYRTNLTKRKKEKKTKNKGGSFIDHQTINCFTSEIRKDDIKKMYNYVVNNKASITKGKCKGNGKSDTSYIYNIVNPYDDLCFLRYIILIKYLCNV